MPVQPFILEATVAGDNLPVVPIIENRGLFRALRRRQTQFQRSG